MDVPVNRFKASLLEGRRQIGLWLALADAGCAEICATAGFDWLLIDAEHAPNDLRTILAQLRAIAAYEASPVVRVPIAQTALIKQVLELGVQTIMAPMIESAVEAQAAARAMRYPPAGVRGVGSGLARSSRWTLYGSYLREADEQVCLIVQIETRKALQALEAIASVEGVDAVFIGASDLAADMGRPGEPRHPEVAAAVDEALARLAAIGRPAGVLTSDVDVARALLERGAAFAAVGVDSLLLANAARALARAFAPEKD